MNAVRRAKCKEMIAQGLIPREAYHAVKLLKLKGKRKTK